MKCIEKKECFQVSEHWSWAEPELCDERKFKTKFLWRLKAFIIWNILTNNCCYSGEVAVKAVKLLRKEWKTITLSQLNYRIDGLKCIII